MNLEELINAIHSRDDKKALYIVQGASGSGKSTTAKRIAQELGIVHRESDDYFLVKGKYKFVYALLPTAHKECQRLVRTDLKENGMAVVANTFTHNWEFTPYVDMAKEAGVPVVIVRMENQFENIHAVPTEVVKNQKVRLAALSPEYKPTYCVYERS